jgi:acyl-[acyl carrier protein]--UDP-N-acetylglucosamine O-acyltransferase
MAAIIGNLNNNAALPGAMETDASLPMNGIYSVFYFMQIGEYNALCRTAFVNSVNLRHLNKKESEIHHQ